MKLRLYTKSPDVSLLKELDPEQRFTAEEAAYVSKKMHEKSGFLENRETLFSQYFLENYHKTSAVGFLIQRIYQKRYKNVLSLGAGTCVLEYLLKCALPEDSKVVATDFDHFLIERAKRLLPSIIPVEFDFCRSSLENLKRLKIDFDLAVFFGSAYVMDDSEFVDLFSGLKKLGVKEIIDFHAGYIPTGEIPKLIFMKLGAYLLERFGLLGWRGKFHGYRRTRGELRRLYSEAGLSIVQELSVPPYKYVAICAAP